MATYELWIADYAGNRIGDMLGGFTSLTWARRVNAKGMFSVTFPRDVFTRPQFVKDYRLEMWRQAAGSPNKLVTVGRLQKVTQGPYTITIEGPGMNDLLDIRIIDADAGTAGAKKTDAADDMMKEYVIENLGSSAVAARQAATFSVQGDSSEGPTIDKSASRDNLLTTLQSISQAAFNKGTPVYFDIIPLGDGTLEFQTFANQRGVDRRHPNGSNPVILEEGQQLKDPILSEDWRGEINYVYGGGKGEGAARDMSEQPDDDRIGGIAVRRRERLYNGTRFDKGDLAGLGDAAKGELDKGRPVRKFTSQIQDGQGFRYGVDWDLGDWRTAQAYGEFFDVEIAAVNGTVSEGGEETIDARLENVD